MPFGPSNLWAAMARGRRRARRRRDRGTGPPGRRRLRGGRPCRAPTRSAISAIGWIVPTSLLASMIADEDRPVGRRRRRPGPGRPARSGRPAARRSRTRTSRGSAGCGSPRGARSSCVTIRWPRALPAQAAPLSARLFASVPPDVKTSSRGSALSRGASSSCASSRAAPGTPAEGVGRRRVPECLAEERQHRLERPRAERGRGGVVEIDGHRPDCTSGPVRSSRRPLAT